MPTKSVKYLVTDEAISFYRESDKSVRFVNKDSNGMVYELLRDCLLTKGTLDILEQDLNLKDCYLSFVKDNKNLFGIGDRLQSLKDSGMPTQPFERFVSRLPESFFQQERNVQFLSRVGTVDAPLTLNGDVVMYQRASWLNDRDITNWSSSDSFTSGNVVSSDVLTVGEFNWVMGSCPDAGPVFEVLVQPQHILNVGHSGGWLVQQLTQLSKLSEYLFVKDRSETAVVSFNTNCSNSSGNAIRLPYSAATMSSYVSMLFADKAEALNNVVPVKVAHVGSC
jgi:hypothetical protein